MGGTGGVILQAHFRSVAQAVTQRSDAAKRHSAAERDPPVDASRLVRVSRRRPLSAGPVLVYSRGLDNRVRKLGPRR